MGKFQEHSLQRDDDAFHPRAANLEGEANKMNIGWKRSHENEEMEDVYYLIDDAVNHQPIEDYICLENGEWTHIFLHNCPAQEEWLEYTEEEWAEDWDAFSDDPELTPDDFNIRNLDINQEEFDNEWKQLEEAGAILDLKYSKKPEWGDVGYYIAVVGWKKKDLNIYRLKKAVKKLKWDYEHYTIFICPSIFRHDIMEILAAYEEMMEGEQDG